MKTNVKKIGFIGAGQMAQALAAGIASDMTDVFFCASDPNAEAREGFSKAAQHRVTEATSNAQVFSDSDIVILATKPQHAAAALEEVSIEPNDKAGPLIISIMAGVTIEKISAWTNSSRVIRVMPNTPCLIGQGASAIAAGDAVSVADRELAKRIFAAVGKVVEVPEPSIDAVTGVSGSGPAYVFRFIEALVEGGQQMGLSHDVASQLAVQTVLGAAALVQETGERPDVLRDRVTSPNGTTLAALQSLEQNKFYDSIVTAVAAATARSQELGRE